MNVFLLKKMTNTELLLFHSCIGETHEALGEGSSFHSRVGIDWKIAAEIGRQLREEIDRRRAAGVWEA